jgi:hypothetical protein
MSMYLWGKEIGLDYAEFYLRHIHPTQNEAEKNLLRDAADVMRERKLVAKQDREALLKDQIERAKNDS